MAEDQGGGLFARTGKDSVNIGGHKIPIAALAGLIALIGVILVLRARKQGQTVAQIGAAPATAADTGFGAPTFTPDYSGALANISAQLTSLSQGGSSLTPSSTSSATGTTEAQPAGFPVAGYGTIPLYLAPGGKLWSQSDPTASGNLATWLPWSSSIRITGAPVQAQGQTWEPVSWGGLTGWVPIQSFQGFQGL